MSIWTNPYLLITSGFIAFLMQFLFELTNITNNVSLLMDRNTENKKVTKNLNILQSHPKCGVASGGREECWWNCSRNSFGIGQGSFFTVKFLSIEEDIQTF